MIKLPWGFENEIEVGVIECLWASPEWINLSEKASRISLASKGDNIQHQIEDAKISNSDGIDPRK